MRCLCNGPLTPDGFCTHRCDGFDLMDELEKQIRRVLASCATLPKRIIGYPDGTLQADGKPVYGAKVEVPDDQKYDRHFFIGKTSVTVFGNPTNRSRRRKR